MRKGFSEAGAARITMSHVYQASRLSRHVMRELHNVITPALVIHAIDDETASPKSAEHVFRNIGSAEKRKVFLGESYHMITLDNERATALFRILQESLTNVARHAGATQVEVSLDRSDGQLTLTVRDNGRGFQTADPRKPNSYGLLGLRERAYLLNGSVNIESAPGAGTTHRGPFGEMIGNTRAPDERRVAAS